MRIAVLGALTRDIIVLAHRGEEYTQAGGGVYYTSRAIAGDLHPWRDDPSPPPS